MNEDPRYFRLGLFVLGAILLMAAVLILFGAGRIFQPRMFFETYVLTSVSGIDKGSPVRFRGVPIGKVSDVTFVFNEYPSESRGGIYNYVLVIMEVTEEVFPEMFNQSDMRELVARAVEHGLRARIEPQGITGLNYVELDYLDPREFPALKVDWTPQRYYIPSAPGQLAGMLDSVNKIMRELEKLNLQQVEQGLRTLLENLNQSVTAADLPALSRDVRALAEHATALVEEVKTLLQQAELPALSTSARQSLDAVRASVEEARVILDNLEPATRWNSDDLHATLANLRIISDNLRELSNELRANPSRLLFGRPPARPQVFDGRRFAPGEGGSEGPHTPATKPGQSGPSTPSSSRSSRPVPRR